MGCLYMYFFFLYFNRKYSSHLLSNERKQMLLDRVGKEIQSKWHKLVLSSWLYLVLWKYHRGWIKNLLEMWIVIPLTLIERKIELLENRSLSILPSCLLIFSCEFNLRLQWTWETGEKWMVVYIFFCHRLSEITSIRITLHWKQVHNPYKPNPTITQLIVRLRGEKIQQIQG